MQKDCNIKINLSNLMLKKYLEAKLENVSYEKVMKKKRTHKGNIFICVFCIEFSKVEERKEIIR